MHSRRAGFLALGAVIAGEDLADAMDLRAFGTRRRTWCGRTRWGPHEWAALALGIWLAAFALPMLAIFTSKLTALVGLAALVTYTLVYTPLKRVTPRALEIGTIPGALPTLMGWSAATGEIAAPAWALFGILVFWQLPHSDGGLDDMGDPILVIRTFRIPGSAPLVEDLEHVFMRILDEGEGD